MLVIIESICLQESSIDVDTLTFLSIESFREVKLQFLVPIVNFIINATLHLMLKTDTATNFTLGRWGEEQCACVWCILLSLMIVLMIG